MQFYFKKSLRFYYLKLQKNQLKFKKIKKIWKILQESYNYCCKILKNIVL